MIGPFDPISIFADDDPLGEQLGPKAQTPPPPPPVKSTVPPPPSDLTKDALAVLDDRTQGGARQVQRAAVDGASIAPDRAAQVLRMSFRLGVPPEIVDKNYDAMIKQQRASDINASTIASDAPALAAFIAQGAHHAALVRPDVEPLTGLEKALRGTMNTFRAAGAGLYGAVTESLWGIIQMGGELTGDLPLADFAKRTALAAHVTADKIRGQQEGAGLLEQSVYSAAESLGTMAPLFLSGMGEIGVLTGMGAQTTGLAYTQARREGVEPHQAATFALVQGIVEAATEKIPVHRMLADVRANAPFVKRIVHLLAPEVIGENVATVLQDLNEWATLPSNQDKTFVDYLMERPSQAALTTVSTLMMIGGQTALVHASERLIGHVTDVAKNSELAKTSPEQFASLIDKMAADSPASTLYVRGEDWTTYWQSQHEDPAQKALEITGDPEAYKTAVATNGDLAIPIGQYAAHIAPTPHNTFFAKNLRIQPDLPSLEDATKEQEELALVAGEIQKTIEAAAAKKEAPEASSSPIRQAIIQQQLNDPGFVAMALREKVDPAVVANVYAAGIEKVLTTVAKRAGQDPVSLLKEYNLTLGAEGTSNSLAAAVEAVQQATGASGEQTTAEPGQAAQGAVKAAAEGVVFYQRVRAAQIMPKGFEVVAPHLLPAERENIRRDVVQRVVDTFKKLPSEKDYVDAALAGRAKRGWYQRSGAAIATVFGETDAPRFTALLAALSPRTSVEANLINATNTWKNWVAAGRPTDRASIQEILSESVQQSEGKDSVLASWVPNTVTALSADDPTTITLSGNKVNPFMRNLLGHTQEVTTDAWMTVFAGTMHAVTGKGLSKASHVAFAAKIRRAAEQLTKISGETWTPAEVQETVWSWAKTLYELSESEGKTAEQVIREGLISDDAITSTPDFAQLFTHDAPVRAILEAAGYGDILNVIETGLDAGAELGAGAQEEGGGAAGGEAHAATPSLLRSARRLDWVRQAREAVTRNPYTELLGKLTDPEGGGFTYDVLQGTSPETGLALAVYPDRAVVHDIADLTPEKLADFVIANDDLLLQKGNNFGAWVDGTNVYLDISRVVSSEKQAQKIGRENEQIAYFDLFSKKSVNIDYPPGWTHGPTWQGPGGPGAVVNEAGESVAPAGTPDSGSRSEAVQASDGERRDAGASIVGEGEAGVPVVVEQKGDVTYFQSSADPAVLPTVDQWATSRLQTAVAEAKQNKASGRDWKNIIKASKLGVNADEFLLTSVDDLEDAKSYTRAEVLEYLRQHEVGVSWQVLDSGMNITRSSIDTRAEEIYAERVAAELEKLEDRAVLDVPYPEIEENEDGEFYVDGDRFDTYDTREQADERARELFEQAEQNAQEELASAAKSNVSWDAAQNQAEQEAEDTFSADDAVKFAEYTLDAGETAVPDSYREVLLHAPELDPKHGSWLDGHDEYDQVQNPIVRLRFDVRETSAGKQVLFIEELQPPVTGNFEQMPGLFQKNWRELGFKWALRHAADLGVSGVAWTTGQQQRDRYLLSRSMKTIEWEPQPPEQQREHLVDGKVIKLRPLTAAPGMPEQTFYVETDRSGKISISEDWRQIEGKPLSDLVGAELADRILKDSSGKIEGDDLDIGGHGLARLYDVDFKNVVKKLPVIKRNGGALETIQIARRGDTVSDQPGVWLDKPEIRQALLAGQTLFQGERQPRGGITFSQSGIRIQLLKDANLSTLLHETGHLYLHLLTNITTKLQRADPTTWTATQKGLVEDHARVMQYLGVTAADQLGEEQHEKFARAFEAYLMLGKSPTPELQPAFSRYRSWLTKIYRTVSTLDVDLNPEITDVFDRLVAGEDEIARARDDAKMTPAFSTPEQAGMTMLQWQGYQKTIATAHEKQAEALTSRLMKELQRQRATWWKERRAVVEHQVTQDVRNQPAYRALLFLQKGELPNGMEHEAPMKLSKAAIVEKYGKERLDTLPRPFVYTTGEGLDPDIAAQLLGFSSGDALLNALAETDKLDDVIRETTDQRMQDEFGNMRIDGTLRQAARVAVEENGYQEILEAELRAIARVAKQNRAIVQAAVGAEAAEDASARRSMRRAISAVAIPKAALEATAQAQIEKIPAKDLKPHLYWLAAKKSGTEASRAVADGRYEDAVAAKQKQRLAVELHRAAVGAQDEVDKLERYAKRLNAETGQKRLGKAGESYQQQINALLAKFDLGRASQQQIAGRKPLGDWMKARQDEGLPIDFAADVLESAQPQKYTDAPIKLLRDLRDGLKAIDAISRIKNEQLSSGKKEAFDAFKARILASIAKHTKPGREAQLHEFRPSDERRHLVADWFASHKRIATLAQQLDGYVEGGPMWELVQRLNDASDGEVARRELEGTKYAAILAKHFPGRQLATMGKMVEVKAIGKSLSREAILSIALNWGNETSRDRVLSDPNPKRRFSHTQVLAILDTLDQRDWQFVQDTWDYIETFWPEIADKQFRVTGIRPEKVEALYVDTKYGRLRGGYYPLAYDGRLAASPGRDELASEAKLNMAGAYIRATTRRGHTQARLDHVERPIRYKLDVMFNHIDQVIHDLTHHEALIDVNRMLRDRAVAGAIHEVGGETMYKQFTAALTDIALGKRPGGNIADKAANFMKTGSQIAGLGLNLWTAAQQPLGLFNGAARVGPTWVARGMYKWMRDASTMENTVAWIHSISPFMAQRSITGQTQDINELRNRLATPGGWFDGMLREASNDKVTQKNLTDAFLWHISLMQRVADVPTWLGAFEKAMAHEANGDESLAAKMADQAVRDSQGSGTIVDLAQIQRGGPIMRLFMTFYSYGNTVYNSTARAYGQTNFRSAVSVARFIGNLSLLYAFPAFGTVMLSRLFGMSGGDPDDEDSFFIRLTKDALREMGATALNTMVLVRELAGLARQGNRGYGGPAGTRLFQQITNLWTQVEQGQVDEGLWHALLSTSGVLFRLPAAQAQRSIDGFVALQEGTTDNPLALLFGPPPKGKK